MTRRLAFLLPVAVLAGLLAVFAIGLTHDPHQQARLSLRIDLALLTLRAVIPRLQQWMRNLDFLGSLI